MSMLKGQTLTLKERGEGVSVSWKQGSFMGFGGDMHETYVLCKYSAPSGEIVPVYIQTSKYNVSRELTVNSRLQYGMQDGVLFYVLHDKSNKPYQHRFRTNTLQKLAYAANTIVKLTKGVDLSWVAGDYLHDL